MFENEQFEEENKSKETTQFRDLHSFVNFITLLRKLFSMLTERQALKAVKYVAVSKIIRRYSVSIFIRTS